MLTSLEWQTLEQRRRISRLVMMYKIQHQLLDIDRDLYLIPGDSRTRGQHRFFQERSNYDTLRNSFQRTAQEWNHLPDTTVGASSIEEFRANLNNRLATPTSVNSFNCVIVKCLVLHSLGDISCVCLTCLVPQNLKQLTTTHVLHWKKKKIQCGCTCVYDLLIAFSKFLTERQQSESVGLSCPNLNQSILHIFKSMI